MSSGGYQEVLNGFFAELRNRYVPYLHLLPHFCFRLLIVAVLSVHHGVVPSATISYCRGSIYVTLNHVIIDYSWNIN